MLPHILWVGTWNIITIALLNFYVTHEYSCKFLCWKVTVMSDSLIVMLHNAVHLKTVNFKKNRLIENICINQKELIHFAIIQCLFVCSTFFHFPN